MTLMLQAAFRAMRPFLPYILGGLLLIGCGWYLRHSGYLAGERAAEARMAARVIEATQRTARIEQGSESRTIALEAAHAAQQTDLDRRYTELLARYERLRQQSASGSPVPQAAADAAVSDGGGDGAGHAGADDSDPRPAFALYGRDAERLRLALRACQQYGAEIEQFRQQVR